MPPAAPRTATFDAARAPTRERLREARRESMFRLAGSLTKKAHKLESNPGKQWGLYISGSSLSPGLAKASAIIQNWNDTEKISMAPAQG